MVVMDSEQGMGNMNAIDRAEYDSHQAVEVAWDDVSAPPSLVLKPFQKDVSYARSSRKYVRDTSPLEAR